MSLAEHQRLITDEGVLEDNPTAAVGFVEGPHDVLDRLRVALPVEVATQGPPQQANTS